VLTAMRKILKSYLFWTYPRGSFHYDVMVTLILAFIFLSPFLINYRERPQETPATSSEVLVKGNGPGAFIFDIGADQVPDKTGDAALREQLLERIQVISGPVQVERYSALKDASGKVTEYRVWVHR
jgi:hypothetical protein